MERSRGGVHNETRGYNVYCFGKVLLELVTGKQGISSSTDATMEEWLEASFPYFCIYKELLKNIVDPVINYRRRCLCYGDGFHTAKKTPYKMNVHCISCKRESRCGCLGPSNPNHTINEREIRKKRSWRYPSEKEIQKRMGNEREGIRDYIPHI